MHAVPAPATSAAPEHACGRTQAAWEVLSQVPDPEVPAVTLVELGIVRGMSVQDDGVQVTLTPTYSGCPATELIEQMVREALARFGHVEVTLQRAPAWTTDWITPQGREKLQACGIVPPGPVGGPGEQVLHFHPRALPCPRCGSTHTERLAAFGATACKALHRCIACGEPFEHFKPL